MPAKKSSRPKTPPDLRKLVAHLRHVADQLEADLPLLDVKKLAPMVESLHTITTAFLTVEATALTVPRGDYQALRHEWLEAWSQHPEAMRDAVATALHGKLIAQPATEDTTLWRLRTLVQTLSILGVAPTQSLVQQFLSATPPPPAGFGMKIDRQANVALQMWGRSTLEDFLAKWKLLDPAMIKRASTVLGTTFTKRATKPQQTDLHRRAQRFARNTAM